MLGNLISLNLSVRVVYESLWLPQQQQQQQQGGDQATLDRSAPGPAMRIVFRLQASSSRLALAKRDEWCVARGATFRSACLASGCWRIFCSSG